MKNLLFVFLCMVMSFSTLAQTNFTNGPNHFVLTAVADTNISGDTIYVIPSSKHVFTFNRDVIGWGTTVSWNYIDEGSATMALEVSNINSTNDSIWQPYPSKSAITIADSTNSGIWDDDDFHWRFGRYVFVSDTLTVSDSASGYVRIDTYVKTQK